MSGNNKRSYKLFVAGLTFYDHLPLKGSSIWKKKGWKFLKLYHSSLLTSNELLRMLTKTNNQCNEKIVNIMSYKVYIHIRMYIYHYFISLSMSTAVSLLTSKVLVFLCNIWVVVDGCVWLWVVAYFSITHKDICSAWISLPLPKFFSYRLTSWTSEKYNRSIAILRRTLLWISESELVFDNFSE